MNSRSKRNLFLAVIGIVLSVGAAVYWVVLRINFTGLPPGIVIDSLDGVLVYNNGPVGAVHGRNLTEDGYNIGLRYQCVEFVKRYYLERYGHRMPDPWGHAKDFFEAGLPDGEYNSRRGLYQYSNGSGAVPGVGDLVVFGPWLGNRFGHVAIVSAVNEDSVEIMQQNAGRKNASRRVITLEPAPGGLTRLADRRVLGWLSSDNNKL